MKKLILSAMLLLMGMAMQAQNVQLHYDFGRFIYPDEEAGRQKVTMTLEQFKADKWGSWFYFVDIDFSRKFTEGAYTEISREFNLSKKLPIAAHVEYNGGLNRFGSFQQAALLGAAWNGHSAEGVWGLNFANGKGTFSGFIDFWRGEKVNGHGQLVMLTEPQLWYNVTPHLSVGSEIEMSSNFIYNTFNDKSFFINPTLAVKWNF